MEKHKKERHIATLKPEGSYYVGGFDDKCNNAYFKVYFNSKDKVVKLKSLIWYTKFIVLKNGKFSGTCKGKKVMLQYVKKDNVIILKAWF